MKLKKLGFFCLCFYVINVRQFGTTVWPAITNIYIYIIEIILKFFHTLQFSKCISRFDLLSQKPEIKDLAPRFQKSRRVLIEKINCIIL